MKIIFGIAICFSILVSCKDKASAGTTDQKKPMTRLDSLLKDIDNDHVFGMSKISKLHIAKQKIKAVIDSIATLPAKTQEAAAPYIAKLKSAIGDLDYADTFMDKWMMEYNEDSASQNEEERIKYLSGEKSKLQKMKEAISGSLQKADSLIKSKF